MFSLALFFGFFCAASGQIKWVETGALNRCGDSLCTETEVCLRPRHYLYPFICFDVIAVPCLKSGLPLSNCYYSDYPGTTDSTIILSTDSTSTVTRSSSTTTWTSTIQSTDSTSTIQSTDSTSTIQSTDSTSTETWSTTTRATSTEIWPTTTRANSGSTQVSNLVIHLGLNVHTALLAGGFVLILVVIVGMAIVLLCFLKKVNRLKDERQPTMEMQPVVTSFHNDAFRALSAYEQEDIPLDNQQWDTTYF